jgi:hypothetical protein
MGNKQDKICAICLDPPTNPQIQSCGHEYCRKCLLDLIKYRKNYYFLLCPLCRQKMTSNERRWVLLSPLRRYQRKQPEISYFTYFKIILFGIFLSYLQEKFLYPWLCKGDIYSQQCRRFNKI